MQCRMLSSIPGFYSLGANSTPSCNKSNCLQTLSNIPQGTNVFWVENHWFIYYFIAYWNIVDVQGCVSFRCAAQWFSVFAEIIHYRLLQDTGYISQWVRACVHVCMFSRVWLLVAPWTAACQAPLSIGFPRQELEWVALSFSRGSSWPKDQSRFSCLSRQILYHWATWEALFRT